MAEIPFPSGPADQDVFFHEDKVCVYHEDTNTWECRTNFGEAAVNPGNTIFTTDVYVPAGVVPGDDIRRTFEEINGKPVDVRTQSDLNQEIGYSFINQLRKATRDRTRIDFIQNTVVEGDWEFDPAITNSELPELGEFTLFKEDGYLQSSGRSSADIVRVQLLLSLMLS